MARNVDRAGRPTQTFVRESPPIDRVHAPNLTMDRHSWMDEAACLPYGHRDAEWCELPTTVAKAICRECPSQTPCAIWSVQQEPSLTIVGVWAGMTAAQLNAKRRKASAV